MTAPTLSLGAIEIVVVMGKRRKGVTVPEVKEHFDVSHLAAWRVVQRLVRQGRLYVIGARRRELLFVGGRGAVVYKTRVRPQGRRTQEEHHGEGGDGEGDEAL